MLYNNLKDILRYTNSLNFIELVKVEGTDEGTTVESLASDKSVVVFGKLKNEINELKGSVVGFSRMSVLNGYINFPAFNEEGSEIKIVTQNRNGEDVPAEIAFKSSSGHNAAYRFMARETIEDQIRMPKFKGAQYDVTLTPTKKNLADLIYFSNILGSFEANFGVMTQNKNFYFTLGTGQADRSVVPFAENVSGTMSGNWRWPLATVIAILKLVDGSECKMEFANAGLLKITLDSGLGTYEYYIPAKTV